MVTRMNANTAHKKLRAICLGLPETNEVQTWGHPTFRAGKKSFAVLESPEGVLCLALRVGLDRRDELLLDSRFCETPYCGHRGWVSLKLTSVTDWDDVRALLLESYRSVALKRMVRALTDNGVV
jgi:predicted DNA-binding protein (MmcQ/YjbR family)